MIKKLASLCIVVAAVLLIAYFLKSIIAPLVLASLLAMSLLPLTNWFEKINIPRLLSSLLSVSLLVIFILSIWTIIAFQLRDVGERLQSVTFNPQEVFLRITDALPGNRSFWDKLADQDLNQLIPENSDMLQAFFGSAMSITGEFISFLFLVPVFIFFILLYRHRAGLFLASLDHKYFYGMGEVGGNVKQLIRKYLSGLSLVLVINASLATLGLWIIGVPNALFLGLLSAALSIIPYIGTAIGALIPTLFAFLVMPGPWYGVGVAALYSFIQLLENNVISPFILGNSVNVNPFLSILALMVMGQFWGIIGMVIAIPLLSILILILEQHKELKKLNILFKNSIEKAG